MLPFHPLGAHVGVRDLEATVAFLQKALDLPVKARGEGWVELDNNSTFLRLVGAETNSPMALVLMANDIGEALAALEVHTGVERVAEEDWVTPERKEARLRYDGWLELIVARVYDEDELGIQPDLPMELEWEPQARQLLLDLLARVPVVFRDPARTKSTQRAEALALEKGDVTVAPFEAVRGLVLVTPVFQHKSLWDALASLGEDPSRWAPELVEKVKL